MAQRGLLWCEVAEDGHVRPAVRADLLDHAARVRDEVAVMGLAPEKHVDDVERPAREVRLLAHVLDAKLENARELLRDRARGSVVGPAGPVDEQQDARLARAGLRRGARPLAQPGRETANAAGDAPALRCDARGGGSQDLHAGLALPCNSPTKHRKGAHES